MTSIETLLQRFGLTASDLSGAALSGEIPLANGVVNRFVAAQLAQRDVPVSSVLLDARDADSFTAQIVPRARFVPPIRIAFQIERQPELPANPILWLRWSLPGMGGLALFAAPALGFFKVLPRGVRVEGERIVVDVHELLVSRGLGEMMAYLRGLRIHTRPGVFLVRFDVKALEA